MDFATDIGDAGLRWVFVRNDHGGPTHDKALDEVARYFNETS
jgi:hypothetical protein